MISKDEALDKIAELCQPQEHDSIHLRRFMGEVRMILADAPPEPHPGILVDFDTEFTQRAAITPEPLAATRCGYVDCPGVAEPIRQTEHGPEHPTCKALQEWSLSEPQNIDRERLIDTIIDYEHAPGTVDALADRILALLHAEPRGLVLTNEERKQASVARRTIADMDRDGAYAYGGMHGQQLRAFVALADRIEAQS